MRKHRPFADGSAKGLNYPKPSFRHRLEDRRSPNQLGFQEINAARPVLCYGG
jgi:hypothetical protein